MLLNLLPYILSPGDHTGKLGVVIDLYKNKFANYEIVDLDLQFRKRQWDTHKPNEC